MENTVEKSKGYKLPISKKAYAGFTERIRVTFEEVLMRPELSAEAVGMLDRYLAGEEWRDAGSSGEAVLAFSMIRTEVDKAMTRSAAARRRAAARRNNKAAGSEPAASGHDVKMKSEKSPEEIFAEAFAKVKAEMGDDFYEEVPDDEEPPFVPRNRRERRAYERELAKAMRKRKPVKDNKFRRCS